jgi:hypothetical protein
VTLVYVMFDKTLAVRLSVLVLLTMCLNHVLKIIIKNPRPFIRHAAVENRFVRVVAVIAIFLTGISRLYLDVYDPRDILIVWLIGLFVGLIAIKRVEKIRDRWNELSYKYQAEIVVASSLILSLATIAING